MTTDLSNNNNKTPQNGLLLNSKLLYNLKAVISHYGTHNYGHYICYRKFRGHGGELVMNRFMWLQKKKY